MHLEQNDTVARAIAEHLGLAVIPPFSGLVVRDAKGASHGAVIVSHFDGEDCEVQCVGHEYWTPGTVRAVFRYVLDGLKVTRVSARTVASNTRCIVAMKAIGFREEGVKRKAHEGEDVVMFGMLRDECRPLAGRI